MPSTGGTGLMQTQPWFHHELSRTPYCEDYHSCTSQFVTFKNKLSWVTSRKTKQRCNWSKSPPKTSYLILRREIKARNPKFFAPHSCGQPSPAGSVDHSRKNAWAHATFTLPAATSSLSLPGLQVGPHAGFVKWAKRPLLCSALPWGSVLTWPDCGPTAFPWLCYLLRVMAHTSLLSMMPFTSTAHLLSRVARILCLTRQ